MKTPVNTNSLGIGDNISSTTFINPYRYGFNGKEKDDQVKGAGNSYDYGMRMYDPRLGRFMSVDPLTHKFPELTPYQFSSDNPIASIDLDGLEQIYYLGAFAKSGNSTLISLLDNVKVYTDARKSFQDVNKNKGYNLIVVEGSTDRAGGITYGFSNENLKSILNEAFKTDNPKGALAKALGGYIDEKQIDDAFIGALQETADQGRKILFNTINKGNVDKSDDKKNLTKSGDRRTAAKSIAHELIAHALEDALETETSKSNEPDAEHKKYFGGRDENGNLKNGGKDCGCGAGYSPPEGEEAPGSTGEKVNTQVNKAADKEP